MERSNLSEPLLGLLAVITVVMTRSHFGLVGLVEMAELHDPTEHYLACIYRLSEDGIPPMRARLVERLGLSAPSVSEHISRLVDLGYVNMSPIRELSLTEAGNEIAERTIRRHRLAELLLVEVIGIPWRYAHQEADRLEHAISMRVENRLVELMGNPQYCPYGHPIPGSGASRPNNLVKLSEVTPGRYEIGEISHIAETSDSLMDTLDSHGLRPGVTVDVDLGENGIVVDGKEINFSLAEHIVVAQCQ